MSVQAIVPCLRVLAALPAAIALLAVGAGRCPGDDGALWAVELGTESLVIRRGAVAVADYIVRHPEMKRPGFANVRSRDGGVVTRSFPPRDGVDATDHAAMHPGIWIAFGDVSGEDFWRNRGAIEHVAFVAGPTAGADGVRFVAESRFRAAAGGEIGRMTSRVAVVDRAAGVVIAWEATLHAGESPLLLGDQEEMGFGIRLATGLEEKAGGSIRNSAGATTAAAAWGKIAAWCDAAGGSPARGITVVPGSENFRPCWWHTRDYGLVVANPFGRRALAGEEPSLVAVDPGETIRLAFAALIHDAAEPGAAFDGAAAAADASAVIAEEFGGAAGR